VAAFGVNPGLADDFPRDSRARAGPGAKDSFVSTFFSRPCTIEKFLNVNNCQ
jgi:hypothetical protein